MNFENLIFQNFPTPTVGKTLKPYQGLKLKVCLHFIAPTTVGKTLKPYQGLKHKEVLSRFAPVQVGKTLKPYQGLKLHSGEL